MDIEGKGRKQTKAIVFDASFLVWAVEKGVPVLEFLDIELGTQRVHFIPSPMVSELKYLAGKKSTAGSHARAALEFLRKIGTIIVQTKEGGDKAVLELAKDLKEEGNRVYVATSDISLAKKCQRAGYWVLFPKHRWIKII